LAKASPLLSATGTEHKCSWPKPRIGKARQRSVSH